MPLSPNAFRLGSDAGTDFRSAVLEVAAIAVRGRRRHLADEAAVLVSGAAGNRPAQGGNGPPGRTQPC